MKIYCCTEQRRRLIQQKTELNGIDYVEILAAETEAEKQKQIRIQFLKNLSQTISLSNIFISKGNELTHLTAVEIVLAEADAMTVRLSDHGDFSIHTLHLLQSWEEKIFIDGFDKLLSSVNFSFKVECFTDSDCKQQPTTCEEVTDDYVDINYLAKDYESFRQLILDRMALIAPDWVERNPADLGMTLVELLAYIGDYLSYRQDAITTEAYLHTSRKRISVRRHARLVDYYMHDGVNARTWVHIDVDADSDEQVLQKTDDTGFHTKFITRSGIKASTPVLIGEVDFEKLYTEQLIVFEPIHDIQLFEEHNTIGFHTFGDENCCLPKGATEAALAGRFENLKVNDVLILKEIVDPETGNEADANPDHRHAVKITEIQFDSDFDFSKDPATELDITIIRWSDEDALPFPLCLTANTTIEDRTETIQVSIAQGNNVLADHGLSISDLDAVDSSFPFNVIRGSLQPNLVPESKYAYTDSHSTHCEEPDTRYVRPRFNPVLHNGPLTQAEEITFENEDGSDLGVSASKLMRQDPRKAVPQIYLSEIVDLGTIIQILPQNWVPVNDLLIDSSMLDRHFVIEINEEGISFLRFGNDRNGKFPDAGSKFVANYRVGNGLSGNIGRNTLRHVVTNQNIQISAITNPMAGVGGRRAETNEEVKQYAPQAFRTQERAVTVADYEEMAKRCKSDIQSVSASLRWTGSWYTSFITADRFDAKAVTSEWENELKNCLESYRLTGVDIEIDDPIYIGIELAMKVCLYKNQFMTHVKQEIQSLLSNKTNKGKKGFFHPDNLVFGQTLYLSKIYSLVQSVRGVQSVEVVQFERYGVPHSSGLATGKLTFGKKEIPRLDNNPNQRDMGLLTIQIKGGR